MEFLRLLLLKYQLLIDVAGRALYVGVLCQDSAVIRNYVSGFDRDFAALKNQPCIYDQVLRYPRSDTFGVQAPKVAGGRSTVCCQDGVVFLLALDRVILRCINFYYRLVVVDNVNPQIGPGNCAKVASGVN
jgi:hypothetical protein